MSDMTDSFEYYENEAIVWHKIYIKSIEIIVDSFEVENFVKKWHLHTAWNADPIKIANDCSNAILGFRQFHTKFETVMGKTSRYLTYKYFYWEKGHDVSNLVDSVDHHKERLLKRGIER